MSKAHISKSILSISTPGAHLVHGDDAQARKLARECNTFAADLKKRRPDRFGFWATLPLPDVEGCLEEIAYSLDELQADGVCMLTNHHGTYPGDALFDPVFAELNRRKATVFIHPTLPCIVHGDNIHEDLPMRGYPPSMFEFFFEEVRVFINLFASGNVKRYPDVKIIMSHAGGALPPILERFARIGAALPGGKVEMNSKDMKEIMSRQFYFDLSGFVFPDQIHGLLRMVDPSRLLYGSDFPYTPSSHALQLAQQMDEELVEVVKNDESRRDVYQMNAHRLLSKT